MNNSALIEFLKTQGYFELRELDDGTVAGLQKLIFTTAICTGLDWECWAYRYCFEDGARAQSELAKLCHEDDEPTGWIARRYGYGSAA